MSFRVDTNDSFQHLWRVWRFVGLHPYPSLKGFYYTYSIIVNFIANVLAPLFVAMNVFLLGDAALIMINLQASPTLITASLKQLVIFLRMPKFHKVKTYIDQLDQRANRYKNEAQYLRNVVKQCHFICMIVQAGLLFSLMSFSVTGLITGKLLVEGWFPLDWTSSTSIYILAFAFQFLSIGFQCVQNITSDAYPPIYLKVVMAHIHVLCMRVSRVGSDPSASPEENYNELQACVKDHKNIIRLFETIEPVISESVMLQFVITAFVICISVVNSVIFHGQVYQIIKAITYIACILSEIYPVCYFGDALKAETDRLTTAIYSCNWVDQPVKFRKDIIIFMQRSQKTNIILAGGLTTISLQTFVSIIRFSFSLFTILSQVD